MHRQPKPDGSIASRNDISAGYCCLGFQPGRFAADTLACDGAAVGTIAGTAAQVFTSANRPDGLSAGFANVRKRSRCLEAAGRGGAGVIALQITTNRTGVWPQNKADLERAAPA